MISKYRLMRGLFKRRLIRVFVWRIVALLNKGKVEEFCKLQNSRASESIFDFDQGAVDKVVSGLERDGALVGMPLPDMIVNYLRAYAERNPCYADRDPVKGFFLKDRAKAEEAIGKPLLLAQYFNVNQDPTIARIAGDPYLLSVAAKYLGATPQLMSINMWWTFPVSASAEEKARHAHVFHYDLDDLKFVKFFFYLTDVDSGSGPHVYVRGSNREIKYKNSIIRSKRFTDDEIYAAYGAENVINVLGKAGTCLVEDTITMHKGITPESKPRLLIQFEYSINTYPEISCVCDESVQKIFV